MSPRFIAVGEDGAIASSLDGLEWAMQESGTRTRFLAVAAGPSNVIAVGEAGVIVSSADGAHWVRRSSQTTADLASVIFTGQKFIAVGGSWELGAITLESQDGVSWTRLDSPSDHMFHAVVEVGGTLVAAAYHRSDRQTPSLFKTAVASGSAISGWTPQQGPDFYDGVTSGDVAMVVGDDTVSTSNDGVVWQQRALPTPRLVSGVATSAEVHAIVGELGTIYRSSDAIRWSQSVSPLGDRSFSDVAHGAASFVAVGEQGAIITSTDGTTWTTQTVGTTAWLSGVTYGPSAR